MGKLTVIQVRNAKPIVGLDGKRRKRVLVDGDGLLLIVAPTGARNWVLRIKDGKRRRDIGLGAADIDRASRPTPAGSEVPPDHTPLMLRRILSLAEAREKAAALRKLAKAGADPIAERDRERRATPTFALAVTEAHAALKSGWSDRTAKAFLASLEEHAVPKLGSTKVDVIGSADVIAALASIWTDKPVMARKVRSRIGQVLAFAKARGWRRDALPDARELRSGLAKQEPGKNFAAMPFAEVPSFFSDELSKDATASRFAVLFTILTAARSGEVRNASWVQIDLEARIWTRPASMMKMAKGHVVTLSEAAVALLRQWNPDESLRDGLIFAGLNGKPLSDMSLTKALRTAGRKETVHGFRSAFRDFAAERCPTIPAMVAEMALAHKVGTATEQAYLRSDLRDLRRSLMDSWGQFAAPSLSSVAPNVIALSKAETS